MKTTIFPCPMGQCNNLIFLSLNLSPFFLSTYEYILRDIDRGVDSCIKTQGQSHPWYNSNVFNGPFR